MSGGPHPRLVAGVYLLLALAFGLIQPLPHLPDEPAHVQYIAFLAEQLRLPLWEPTGGEAGYESQHPPLSYLLYAPAYRLLSAASPVVLHQGLRVVAALVGLGWLLLCWRLFARVLGDADARARYALATVAWMPLVVLYGCHPNPDLVVGLWATAGLWLAWETAVGRPQPRRAAALGAVVAAACLTKLSGLAVVLPACAASLLAVRRHTGPDRRAAWRDAVLAAGVALLLLAPWTARNLALYGRPVVKTAAPYGSALEHVVNGDFGAPQLLRFTLKQTYLSTWIQPDWLPGWPLAGGAAPVQPFWPVVLFYSLLTGLLLAALAGLRRRLDPGARDLLGLGAVLLLGVLLGHQAAFWTQDIEFNMGGRYVLSAMAVIGAGFGTGLVNLGGRRLAAAWLGLLLVLNLLGAAQILTVLNPHYHPGWKVLTIR